MTQRSYRIRGSTPKQERELSLASGLVALRGASRRLVPGSARDGVTGELEVTADEVVRVELENGFVLWTRADDLVREHGREALGRDGTATWEFGAIAPLRAPAGTARGERGALGLGIKALEFFGIDLKEKAAGKLGGWAEKKLLKGNEPGLYRCPLDDGFALAPVPGDEAIPAGEGPILVFLHGTASSAQGSFGKLWATDNQEGRTARGRLAARYGQRAFAFEHCSLTASPIENALELAQRMPEGAKLHLVSHSRGGLVGELLCLGGCENLDTALPADRVETLFAADRTIAEQSGLSPLDPKAAKERDDAYGADRARLVKLLKTLKKRRIRVERFVRVACPARGTTLASGRLDRWLSVLDFLAQKVTGDGVVGDAVDFLLAVVKERTDPRTLPGLEAMMPGSALTRLLQHPALVTGADLTVIAGDIEGESLWQKLKLLATDWFYGADHDLVVNTGSMSGGLRRSGNGARFRRDQGPEVNHFSYFANGRSVRWLVAGLTRADNEDGGFLPIAAAPKEEPRWRGAVARSRAATAPRPLAVVVPGIMGSHLKASGDHVWLNYGSLLLGGLKKIGMGAQDVEPVDLIDDFYGPLLEFLARTHRVEILAYDWRRSVLQAASSLADKLEAWLPQAERENQPVHLVAHSMGGLVVRAMIADKARGAGLWQRVIRLPNSRFLMLGTPNLGSYEAVRWLTGFNPTQAKLSLLDITQGTDEIIDLVRKYPGLLELLPFGPDDPDFADPRRWQTIRQTTRARWNPAEEAPLRDARRTWQVLRDAAPDPRYMRYVAGCQPATVVDYRFSDYDAFWLADRKRIDFVASQEGDGTVAWASGALKDVPMWYVEDTAHDALCARKKAFPGYLELLMTGATTRLAATPPARRRDAAGAAQRFVLPPAPPTDDVPAESALRGFGFGGGPFEETADDRPAAPTIRVGIRHGDLSYAKHPVLVGHYLGDTVVSAEAVLDRQLDGALTRRLDLGIYPGRLGTHALFFNETPRAKPGGAIVIGLGQVGELTPGLLEASVRDALLNYALQVARWPDDRFGKKGSPRSAAVSCLLVGSGAGGMPVRDSVESILRGAVGANRRLVEAKMDDRVTIDEVEFLELYEDVAIGACEGLRRTLEDGELAAAAQWQDQAIVAGQAGRRRVRFDEAPEWWQRMEIVEDKGRQDVLRFIFATDRARAEETLATGQLALAESFIREASRSPVANPEAARTLFEMLLPLPVRELAPRQSDLVLLVDERSARYPWELLEDRWSVNGRPPAVAAGLVRQLKTPDFRARPAHPFKATALVIGNPDLGQWEKFSDLPGARQEAQRVAQLLAEHEFQPRDCIDEKSDRILENLHRDAWRILHLAGHGEHDYPLEGAPPVPCDECGQPRPQRQRRVSGMVIGKNAFLTPGDVEQMRWVPELVFINCCHLGKTLGAREVDRSALAANLGVQFIRMGVRAVVAAGWAVDDAAALAFAETFYRRMLGGDFFGEAVRAAREEIWTRFPSVNTWGAYQCYGDPSYRLVKAARGRNARPAPFHAPAELVAELDSVANSLKASGQDRNPGTGVAALLGRVPQSQREAWLGRADVCAAVGFVWGEARSWATAIEWLDKALAGARGDCPIRVVEQCANFKVRLAGDEWLELRSQAPADLEAQRLKRVKDIEGAILELDILCRRAETEERLSLLGSACKRLAIVETAPERRKEALVNMAAYYRKAFELGKRSKAYAFTNWATAQLVALRMDATQAGEWQTGLEAEAGRISAALEQACAKDPNFWDSASLADVDVVRLLARCTASAPGAALPEECRALADEIRDHYAEAIRRGASPRERASVIENLDFVIELVGTAGPLAAAAAPLADAFRRIRDAL